VDEVTLKSSGGCSVQFLSGLLIADGVILYTGEILYRKLYTHSYSEVLIINVLQSYMCIEDESTV
jgi:hypothetical protein